MFQKPQASNGVEATPESVDAMAQLLKRLEHAEQEVERQSRRVQMLRAQISQYQADLVMWMKVHGNEYPARRIMELQKAITEIEAV